MILYHGSNVIVQEPQILENGFYKDFGQRRCTKGQYGQKWLICVPAALLSLHVRPVRVVQVPCTNANHHIFDSATSALRILPGFQADEGGVLDVR